MNTNNPAEMIPYTEKILEALNGLTLKEADRVLSFTQNQLFNNAVLSSSNVDTVVDNKEEIHIA
jgi:hypothetical protein